MVFSALAGIASRALPFLSKLGGGIAKVASRAGGIIGKGIGGLGNLVKGGSSALRRGASIASQVGKGLDTAVEIGDRLLSANEIAKQSGLIPESTSDNIATRLGSGVNRGRNLSGAVADISRGLSSAGGVF